ncbi:MAG: hypothetical protein JKY67_03865 [Pseudomonadales bacterium]|nr:hypothetical protein [Pseudomonadales bacterium]
MPLTFNNVGNVPINLRPVGLVWLEESNWSGRTLVNALRNIDSDHGIEDILSFSVKDMKKSMVKPARIKIEPREVAQLMPGVTLERTIDFTLPKGLRKGAHYKGFIKFNEITVWMNVFCNGSENSTKRI